MNKNNFSLCIFLFYRMDLSLSKANAVKKSLSKMLYERVFHDLMFLININLSSSSQPLLELNPKMKINMLDIAGFGIPEFISNF